MITEDKKQSKVVTVYLKDSDLETLNYLKSRDANVSKICRQAIRDAGQRLQNRETSTKDLIRNEIEKIIKNLTEIKTKV